MKQLIIVHATGEILVLLYANRDGAPKYQLKMRKVTSWHSFSRKSKRIVRVTTFDGIRVSRILRQTLLETRMRRV